MRERSGGYAFQVLKPGERYGSISIPDSGFKILENDHPKLSEGVFMPESCE